MDGRHEVKHYISVADYDALRARLGTVLKRDVHTGADGTYLVRSLYFDTGEDRALYEKLDGVRDRDKYRLRYYDYNIEFIQLEKKSKHSDLCVKRSERITREEVIRTLDGNLGWMKGDERPLIKELYGKMEKEHLMPKTIVDYTRDPFVFPAGNVRVTLDHHIRAGMDWQAFLFWTIAGGIVLAAGMLPLAVFGSVFIGIVLIIFANRKTFTRPYMAVISCMGQESEEKAMEILHTYVDQISDLAGVENCPHIS